MVSTELTARESPERSGGPKKTSGTGRGSTVLQVLEEKDMQVLEEKDRKGRGSDMTGFRYQSNLKHAGHAPPRFSSSAPVSFPVTPRCVPPSSLLLTGTQLFLVPNTQQSLSKTIAGMRWVNRQT